ncbi:MAG TPA: DMT family transporter [Candidatus Acidoferrales bacterium]|nr:DMT family transporter [Candidatus Acidoferrales bacterium]
MISIFFALIAFLGWATGDIFSTSASRKMGAYNASFYGYFIAFITAAFFIPIFLNNVNEFSLPMILLTIFLSVIQLIGFYFFNEGLKIGNASLIGTIAGAFTFLVVLLSLVFLGERLVLQQVLSIIVIIAGLFLVSINVRDIRKKVTITNKGILYAFIALVGWGIYYTFIKIPIKEVGFFWPTFLTDFVASLVFFLFGFRQIKKPSTKVQSGFPAVILASIILSIGTFSFNFAIGQGFSSIVAPIAGAYPALFALLAYYVFKDPITNQQKFGMMVTLIGIVFLAYFSK